MRDSATPTRDAPLRRLALLGLVFVAAILSCGKDVTGPGGGRFARGLSWRAIFPQVLRDVGVSSSGVVDFNRVHVVLHHSDGTVALDTTIAFPATADSLTVSLSVKLLSDAPASGEPMTLDLGYVNAAGDTVFKGGPIALTAAPAPAGGGVNPPVQVPVAYTGPGASATSVAITPHTSTVVAGAGFTLTATAKDAGGNALPGTPVIWTSLDPTIATITAPAAGAGVALGVRGTARILAQLITGAMDTAQLVVTLPASQIVKPATASGDAQTGTAGVALAQPIVVKVAASDGVGVAGTTVTFAVAAGGGSVAPLTAVSDANGLASTTWTLGTGTGAQSVTGAVATLTGSPLTYTATATAGAATKLAVTTQPANASGGALMPTIVVTAEDANGNVATTFTGAVTMALGTTTSGAVLGGTATVNAVAGVAAFSALTINKAFAGYTLVASSGALTPATSTAFSIAVGAATSVSTVGGNAQTGTVGVALPTPIAVKVVDAGGNGVSGKTVTFAPAGGSVAPTSITTDVNGLAVTTWTLGPTAGAQSMTATATGLTNSPLTIAATGVAVVASKLVFTTAPASTSGGAPLAAFAVTAEDASGNIAATFTGAVTLALGNTTSGAALGGTTTVAAVAGVATFSAVSVNKAFTGYTLVASATGPTSATSGAFDITIGAATTIATVGGAGQTGTVGVALPTPVAVRVTDAGGNGVSGTTVAFAPANGSVLPVSAVSDANGLAVTTWTLGATAGSQSMTATATGLTNSPLTISATGVAVAATKLVFTTAPASTSGGAAMPSFAVTAEDASGNIAATFTSAVSLALGNTTSGAALSGTTTISAVAGVATFSTVSINKAFTGYTLVASATGPTSATSPAFDIVTGAAATITAVGGTGQTGTVNAALPTPMSVRVTDAGGNGVSGKPISFATTNGSVSPTSGVTDANGLVGGITWTLGSTVGPQSMTATSAGVPGSPLTITATGTAAIAGPATQLSFSTQPSTVAAGASIAPAIVVHALDANGLLATTFVGNVTLTIGTNPGGSALGGSLSLPAVGGVVTFSGAIMSKVGVGYTLVASSPGLTSGASTTFDVTPGPGFKLIFTTAPVTTMAATPLPMVVSAEDAEGNIITSFTSAVTLAFGSTTSGATLGGTVSVNAVAGLATFSTVTINKAFAGYTLVASGGTLTSATSGAFNITPGPAANIAIISAGNGQTAAAGTAVPTAPGVTVTDASGNPVSGTSVTFTVASGAGTVSPVNGVVSTNASGQAFVTSWALGTTAGPQTLVAASTGLAGSPVTFTATAQAGPASKLAFTTAPVAATGGATLPAFAVSAEDANSNVVTTFTGAVGLALGTTTSGAVLGGTVSVNAVAGVATFSTVSINKAFNGYTLVASATGPSSMTSAPFNITTGAATTIATAGGTGQTGPVSAALPTPIAVRVTDAGGNGVSGTTVTFATTNGSVSPTSGVTDANGLVVTTWTLGATVGSQSMTATSGTLTNSPLTITATGTAVGLKTWTGATSATWAIATNWAPSGVPASTDSVFVPVVSNLPNLTTSATIKALTLAPGASLSIAGAALTVTSSLDATGGIVGSGGVTLNSAAAATVKGTMVQFLTITQGAYTVNGALAASGMQLNSGSLDLNGQAVVLGTNGFGTAGTATIIMNQAGSTLTTTGGATFAGGDETGKLTAGTLSIGSSFSEGGGNAAAFNAGTAHTLILNGSTAASLTMNDPTTSIIGNLVINDAAGVAAPSGFIANNVTITTGTLSGSAGATINGTLTDPLAHWAAGNIIFATSATPISATTPSVTAAQITFNNNPSNIAGNLTINGTVNVLGNLVASGHTLTINGALSIAGANGQLTMNNAADIVNVTGNVTFGSTGVGGLMTAGTLNIGGNFLQQNGPQSITTGGTNTIVFNGAGTQTVIFSSPDGNYAGGACASSACVQNLTVNKTAGQLNFLTTTKVQGNFLNSSTTLVQTPVSNGTFIVDGSASFGQNGTFYHVGVGGSTFSKGAGSTIDSVTYFGAGQAFNPATLGEVYADVRGTSNWTTPGTLPGQVVVDGFGQLSVATSAVVTGNFTTSGSGTLKMTTNLNDSLSIGGNATFGGGATTGLLTTGNIVVSGSTITNTAQAFDPSGAQTTTFNGTTGTQSLVWISPVAGHGYNNLTLRGAAQRQFGASQYINGNMLIASTSGNVNGSWTLTFAGNITDSTLNHNAWNGSSLVVMTGAPTVLPRSFGVNTLTFSGGTVTLADTLKNVGYLVVDGASAHLKLNGHYVGLTANFTTQNGGVLEMTNTHDTLDVAGGVTFNGGSTAGLLTHGFINVGSPGFSQGGPNPAAFSADSSLRVSIGRGNATSITFANQGSGTGFSHFGELMIGDGSTHTLGSDVYVQGQLTTASGGQFPVTGANHQIMAQGANATHLFLTAARLVLVDGSPITALTDLRFSSMDPSWIQLDVQRSGTPVTGDFGATLNAPVFNSAPTTGLYIRATDTDGISPFLTIAVSSPTPAITGGLTSALSGAVISGWPASVVANWLGVSNAWNSTSNWSTGVVPTAGTDVAISCDCSAPQTSVSSAVHNLTITNGNQLTLGSSAPLTVNGDLSVASGSDINVGNASVTLLGNVTMDPTSSPGGVYCGNGSTGAILLGTGTQNVTGKFCRLTVGSTVTATGAIVVKNNNTGAGGLTVQSGGNINFNGQRVETDSMYTKGTGTITMQAAHDSLVIHGANVGYPVYFNGGSTTGLITNGTVVDRSTGFQVNGTAFDAANGLNTLVADSAASQSFNWIGASVGHGLNNVILKNSSKNFSSDLVIGGTLTLDASMTTSGAFQATGYSLYAGTVVDNTGNLSGGLSGAYWVHLTSSGAAPAVVGVDSLFFESGGNMQLTNNVLTSAVVVVRPDVQFGSNTGLLLNGHILTTTNRDFITTGNAFLAMTNAADSLYVGAGSVFFNGGGYPNVLTAGGIAAGGFYQGYINSTTPAAGAAVNSYNPSGTHRLWLTQNAKIIFANPGTGTSASHFNTLRNPAGAAITLYSDMFVDDSIYFATSGTAIFNSDQPGVAGQTRLITTQGLADNTTSTGIEFNNVALKWVNGRTAPSHFDNVQWTGFPALYSGTVFEVNRSSAAVPSFNSHDFLAVISSGLSGGAYVLNSSPSTGPTLTFGNSLGLGSFSLGFGQHNP